MIVLLLHNVAGGSACKLMYTNACLGKNLTLPQTCLQVKAANQAEQCMVHAIARAAGHAAAGSVHTLHAEPLVQQLAHTQNELFGTE
jgi:hypothetical protein